MQIDTSRARPRIVAVLGPTNTGKTYLAMERMLGHGSGIIGFPLRLLARENYDRAVAQKGRAQVALITGEEKIIPPGARYFLCTVESMPLDRDVAFLGIDEIQMCADPDRGHIFTERLLFARGRDETMFMGSDVIRPLLRQLVPEAEFITRPRLSTLSYTGERKTARLRPRTAVVAFSAAEVYALAELVRRQRGGAAVVMGALSPRTRNAQVAMYQSGEVDYMVATDAIGMGLNMDVAHVAFAAAHKFDGRKRRPLNAAELAQTAGRAGRYMNDGTFGVTGPVGPLDAEVVERIENHRFEALKFLCWRNPDLDFSSLARLRRSLSEPPRTPGLIKAREADDEAALGQLAQSPDIAAMAATSTGLRLLWDVCRIPDFGKVMSDAHAGLQGKIYRHLMGPGVNDGGGRIPADWLDSRVSRLDNTSGDIETLAARIAGIRTWTYVAYHADWLDDARHWQDRTREIEDKLSDALHRGLTQRFVDKRTAVLVSRIKQRDDLLAAVDAKGAVSVEGHPMGRLEGFRYVADDGGNVPGTAAKKVSNAAERALRSEIEARLRKIESDADDQFALVPDDDDGTGGWPRRVAWRGAPVARVKAGAALLKPALDPLFGDLLETPDRDRLARRLQAWLDGHVASVFLPLQAALTADLGAPARGIAFQLSENLGSLDRARVEPQIESLGRAGRKSLKPFGIRLGRHLVYMPALLKPRAVMLRGMLWALWNGFDTPPPPPPGRVSVGVDKTAPAGFYQALGYVPFGALAVRGDIAERLASMAWALARKGAFAASPELLSLAGCGADEMTDILAGLGYRAQKDKTDEDGVIKFRRAKRPPGKNKAKDKAVARAAPAKAPGAKGKSAKTGAAAVKKPKPGKAGKVDKDSPFAKLQDFTVAR